MTSLSHIQLGFFSKKPLSQELLPQTKVKGDQMSVLFPQSTKSSIKFLDVWEEVIGKLQGWTLDTVVIDDDSIYISRSFLKRNAQYLRDNLGVTIGILRSDGQLVNFHLRTIEIQLTHSNSIDPNPFIISECPSEVSE